MVALAFHQINQNSFLQSLTNRIFGGGYARRVIQEGTEKTLNRETSKEEGKTSSRKMTKLHYKLLEACNSHLFFEPQFFTAVFTIFCFWTINNPAVSTPNLA